MSESTSQTAADTQAVNPEATGTETTVQTPDNGAADTTIDWKKKFSESSRGAQELLEEKKALLEEKKALEAELALIRGTNSSKASSYGSDPIGIDGFESLTKEQQDTIIALRNVSVEKATDVYRNDPVYKHAKTALAEKVWNEAFEEVAKEMPDIVEIKSEFKNEYFNPDNTPENLADILKQLAKVKLYDKAKEIGAKEALEKSERIDTERANGGDKTPSAGRTPEDWHRMSRENPANFAKLQTEFEADMRRWSGK